MISIENSPSDPSSSSSCPCTDQSRVINSSNRDNSGGSDEKKTSTTSDYDDKLAFIEKGKEEVDLLKSSVHNSNPPPEFSIRNYVNGLRSKDVTKNWPFSKETLMLCLKLGVKNFLPPFQTLDSSKNPSVSDKRFPANSEIVTNSNGEPSKESDQLVSVISQSVQYNPKLDSGNKIHNCTELGVNSLVEVSKKKVELEVPSTSQKKETASQPISQVKKCKLLAKSSLVYQERTNEDFTPNNFKISETMASKVCPVCKTFTSSSNTTLNAHIDQCLSGESTKTWTANPKVVKNRVKPRKMGLMVDIYKTARPCTIEELDRRNGTNWANNSSFAAQEGEFHGEEQEKAQQPVFNDTVETGHEEGDVYIDADGTKVRILSFPRAGDDGLSRKLMKRKVTKVLGGKNEKKTRGENHHKFLKLSPRSKKFRSPKLRHGFKIRSNQEENLSIESGCQEEDTLEQRFQSEEELDLDNDQGAIKPWAKSKRSGHTEDLRHTMTRNFSVEGDQTSSENRCFSRTLSSSDNTISSPESSEKTNTSHEPQDDDYVDQPILRKRAGFLSGSSASNKKGMLRGQFNMSGDIVGSSKARKLRSLRKNVMSANQSSMPDLKSGSKRKFSALKKARSHVEPYQMVHGSGKTSHGGSNVMEIRKTRAGIKVSGQPRNTVMDPLAHTESYGKEIETREESLTIEPNSTTSVRRNYLNTEFDSQHSIEVYQRPFTEPERPTYSPQGSLDGREMLLTEEDTGKTMTEQTNNSKSVESDYNEMRHGVYFLEVERIPIPGPPGSFLPSPGADLVSEDVQGNSSLTNSRVHSSEDRIDFVDKDSMLDSPISGTSTISNPTLTRSNSRSSEKLTVRSGAEEEENPIQEAGNFEVGERTKETIPEKGFTSSSRNDHQPCCCSRKEGVAQPLPSLYQESALLRRRATAWNKHPETFTLSNYPPEKKAFVPPENNSNTTLVPVTTPADTSAVTPSSSNPVLRLMGKDLMVVKKDQDVSAPQLTSPQSTSFDHPNRQSFKSPAVFPSNLQTQNYQSLPQVFPSYGYMTSNSNSLSGSHPHFMPQSPPDRSSTGYSSFARPFNNNQPNKEIIVIEDDSPENGSMRSHHLVHFPSGHNPRQIYSLYNNQSQESFSYSGTQVNNDASFPRPVSREMMNNAVPPVWNRVPEGSSMVGASREMNTSPAMWNRSFF